MKKLLTLALVAAMLTATGITAFATDTEIKQDTTPPTGAMTVNYTADPVYTVVIPESVELAETAQTAQIKIYGADENSNVVLESGKKVNVALSASVNNFNVVSAKGSPVAYTVNDKNAVDDLTTVAECTAAEGKKNTDITFAKTGTAAYAGTYTDTLTFTVSLADAAVAVTGVTLNKTSLELTAGGDTATLTATVAPDTATDKTVTWSSDTPTVATVVNGVVTPVAAGTATITATAGDKSATCSITVNSATPKYADQLSNGYLVTQAIIDNYWWLANITDQAGLSNYGYGEWEIINITEAEACALAEYKGAGSVILFSVEEKLEEVYGDMELVPYVKCVKYDGTSCTVTELNWFATDLHEDPLIFLNATIYGVMPA